MASAITGLAVAYSTFNGGQPSFTLSWVNHGPYSKIDVYRSIDGGAYAVVYTTTTGTVTSWQDTTIGTERKVQYKIQAKDSSTGTYYQSAITPPYAAPAKALSSCVATRTGLTSSRVQWSNTSKVCDTVKVFRTPVGGAESLLTMLVGYQVASYTDSTVPAEGCVYRVEPWAGSWRSGSASSATLVPVSAPSAPTPSAPTGVINRASAVVFTWAGNYPDGSTQQAYEVQYRETGTSTWVSGGAFPSAVTSVSIAGSTFAVGKTYEWQVRTWGFGPDPSPWSASRTFTAYDAPVVTIVSPASGGQVNGYPFIASWTFSDYAGLTIASTVLTVKQGATVLHTVTLGAGVTTYSLPSSLPDASSLSLVLLVTSSSGLTRSNSRAFTTAYAPPTASTLDLYFDPSIGSVEAVVTWGTGTPATVRSELYRVESDGTATLLTDDIANHGSFLDTTPEFRSGVVYRVMAYSATGVPRATDAAVDCFAGRGYYIAWGDQREYSIRLDEDVSRTTKPTAEASTYPFAGRVYPVMYVGEHRTETTELEASVTDPDVLANLLACSRWGGRVMYRDPDGYRTFARMTLSVKRGKGTVGATASLSFEAVDGVL